MSGTSWGEIGGTRWSDLSILLKRLPSGVAYEGNLLGIKLGASFAEVKSILGNPINWGFPILILRLHYII